MGTLIRILVEHVLVALVWVLLIPVIWVLATPLIFSSAFFFSDPYWTSVAKLYGGVTDMWLR